MVNQESERRFVSPRILTEQQILQLESDVFVQANLEGLIPSGTNLDQVKDVIAAGIVLMQRLERAAIPHPQIYSDTDIIYHDTGPGPVKGLYAGVKLADFNYHALPSTRKMDRSRFAVSRQIAAMVTSRRIQEKTGYVKSTKDLTTEDYEQYGPYFMYSSTDWQNTHAREVIVDLRKDGYFKIPDSKIIMYDSFMDKTGKHKKIVHTGDQIEGLTFRNSPDGSTPRRIVIVTHPAHAVRILHYLGKNEDRIPEGSTLQLFPIPTPAGKEFDATIEYAKAELMGTLKAVFKFGEASLKPYSKFEI